VVWKWIRYTFCWLSIVKPKNKFRNGLKNALRRRLGFPATIKPEKSESKGLKDMLKLETYKLDKIKEMKMPSVPFINSKDDGDSEVAAAEQLLE